MRDDCESCEILSILIEAYKNNDHWGESDYHRWPPKFQNEVKDIIENKTTLKIEEVLK